MSDIDRHVHMTPAPEAVARLMATHGPAAAHGRWYWIAARTLDGMALRGGLNTAAPDRPRIRRRRGTPLDVELAAVEAAFALGSARAAEDAAGMGKSALQPALNIRGLPWPGVSSAVRGRNTRDGQLADQGDAAARARIEARLAFNRAVFEVCRAALALVPEQPETGRRRLPEPGPALAAALADFPPAAVEAVFPSLVERTA